jgi:hypothetical protein
MVSRMGLVLAQILAQTRQTSRCLRAIKAERAQLKTGFGTPKFVSPKIRKPAMGAV